MDSRLNEIHFEHFSYIIANIMIGTIFFGKKYEISAA